MTRCTARFHRTLLCEQTREGSVRLCFCFSVNRKVLELNGTIGDVVVSTMLCVCVVQPHRCGIGGGFFATYYNRSNRSAIAFNAREVAPAKSTTDMYQHNSTYSNIGRTCTGHGRKTWRIG